MTILNKSFFKLITIIPIYLLLCVSINAQEKRFINPIIPGGHPDPSICNVDDTFYIVNSSFEYFPGLPIHKSTDLINWELVGYGLHREDQCKSEINLIDVQSDGGIHAPTIRYHNGLFYIITTNVYYHEDSKTTDFVNFIITAKKPEGPWSEPHILDGAPGIDPDIFFDDDGKVWYVGTHSPENPNFPGEGEIWLQEIDIENWTLKGERSYLWRGACGGVWAEGPHMYKKDGRYYLMIAEGGTSYNHAMMIAVSEKITGPYIPNDRNPILTTRHLSYDNWVHSTGHADMIELNDGRWYMVALGIRGDQDRASNMGRETFLVPMTWEKEPFEWKQIKYEWPVIAPISGKVERLNSVPFDKSSQVYDTSFSDNFDSEDLHLEWNFRRVPLPETYSLSKRNGFLRLFASSNTITNRGRTSLLGVRQKESDFEYTTRLNFITETTNVEAGISLFQKDDNYINYTVIKTEKNYELQIVIKVPEIKPAVLHKQSLKTYSGDIQLKVISKNGEYQFLYKLPSSNSFTKFIITEANLILSKGYTGAYLGLYASSNGKNTKAFADFDWIEAIGFQRF